MNVVLRGSEEFLPRKPLHSKKVSLYVLVMTSLASVALGAGVSSLIWWTTLRASKSSSSSIVCSNLCRQSTWPLCSVACDSSLNYASRPSSLGHYITFDNAIQHVGITTSNLTNSVRFYTDIMGGVEVIGAGGDGWKGDDVYQLLMQAALVRGGEAAAFAANLSAAGPDVLDARYVAFDSMVLELLDYRTEEAKLQDALAGTDTGSSIPGPQMFPTFSASNIAPSVAHNMHVAFNVRPSIDLNEFVKILEAESHAAGFDKVLCNRIKPVPSINVSGVVQANVTGIPTAYDSYTVTNHSNPFEGWSLAYCKGPDGEQLEFNVVRDKAAADFLQAKQIYFEGKTNGPLW